MMGTFRSFFDFTTGQLRFLVICSLSIVVLGGYLFVRSYARPSGPENALPVFFGTGETRVTGPFVLDPNTAPADSLELLPGIGTVLADRIVTYRQHHRFDREIDITEVKGIGPRLYERLRPYLRVNSR